MARSRGSKSGDDFSPWPSYVDIFSSTIMVLLLFMLVLFALIAHYAELSMKLEHLKVDITGEKAAAQKEQQKQNFQRLVINESYEINTTKEQNASNLQPQILSEGGALRRDEQNQTTRVEFKKDEMEIVFKNMDVFVTKQFLDEVSMAIKGMLRKQPQAKIYITVGDPKQVLSSTMAKQISLGRVLNIRNKLNKTPELENKISIAISQKTVAKYDYGHLKLEVRE